MIKPSIGRVVLYNDGQSDQRVPASVCYVHDDQTINIGGFRKDGTYYKAQGVHLCGFDEKCEEGMAEWMEYQKQKHLEETN